MKLPTLPPQVLAVRISDANVQRANDATNTPLNTLLSFIRGCLIYAANVLTATFDVLVVNTSATIAALTATNATLTTLTTTSATIGTSTVTGNATVGGTLGVTGSTTLTGALQVNNTLGVTGTSTLAAVNAGAGGFTTLASSGLATLNSASITNNETVGGTLGVTGTTTLAGAVQVNNVETIAAINHGMSSAFNISNSIVISNSSTNVGIFNVNNGGTGTTSQRAAFVGYGTQTLHIARADSAGVAGPVDDLVVGSGQVAINTGTFATALTVNGQITIGTQSSGGTPSVTGQTAGTFIFDTSNNKLWFYNGSAWKGVVLT